MTDFARNDELDLADDDLWQPPETFRDGLADAEAAARTLLEQLAREGSLLIPVDRVEFLARRIHRLTRDAHRSLPPEVT